MARIIKKNTSSSAPILFAFEEFIREKEILGKSKATISNYVTTYGIFVNDLGLDDTTTEVKEIGQDDFFDWIGVMREADKKVSTINHYLRDMRTFFNWCMSPEKSYIEVPYKIPTLVAQEEQIKLFTDEQIEALLERPRKKDNFATWRTWAIVNWVLGTGNRAATICDIHIEDLNFNAKQIILRHTKNKKAQTIPLSPALERVIKEYMRMYRSDAKPHHYLFPSIEGKQLTTNALRQAFTKYCAERDVNRHNIHGLRHNFAKGWVMNNGNMFTLQRILGHQTLEMTRKYVRLFGEDLKQDFDTFNPLDTIKNGKSRKQVVKRAETETAQDYITKEKLKENATRAEANARDYLSYLRKGK